MTLPTHTTTIVSRLAKIREQTGYVLRAAKESLTAANSRLYPFDLLVIGAAKRHVSNAAAFCQLVEAWNLTTARALLRFQIDTTLRFSAAWLVDQPHDFASKVLGGERIDRLRDRNGKRLTDAHLVEVHSEHVAWLPEVYKNLSGYVHFSSAHIMGAIQRLGEDHTAHFAATETDEEMPESSWIEVTDCFLEITSMLIELLHDWRRVKDNPSIRTEGSSRTEKI